MATGTKGGKENSQISHCVLEKTGPDSCLQKKTKIKWKMIVSKEEQSF